MATPLTSRPLIEGMENEEFSWVQRFPQPTHSQSSVADRHSRLPVFCVKTYIFTCLSFPQRVYLTLPFKMSSILHKSYQNLLSHKDILYRSGFINRSIVDL